MNPPSANAIASANNPAQSDRPHLSCADCMSAGVPGVPTDRPPTTASKKPIGSPSGVWNSVGVASSGAVSRPSSVVTSPLSASYQTRNAPPPRPELCGSTSPRTACTATIASAAVPPSRSTRAPASTASGFAAATIQFSASTGVPASLAASAAKAASERVPKVLPVSVAASGATASAVCCANAGVPARASASATANGNPILLCMIKTPLLK